MQLKDRRFTAHQSQYYVQTSLTKILSLQEHVTFLVSVNDNEITCTVNRTHLIKYLEPKVASDLIARVVKQHHRHWDWQSYYDRKFKNIQYQRVYSIAHANQLSKYQLKNIITSFETQLKLIVHAINRTLRLTMAD